MQTEDLSVLHLTYCDPCHPRRSGQDQRLIGIGIKRIIQTAAMPEDRVEHIDRLTGTCFQLPVAVVEPIVNVLPTT